MLLYILSFRMAPPMAIAIPVVAVISTIGVRVPFPGLILISLVLLVPVLWLFWLSAFDAAGELSWANYERMGKSIYVRTFTTTYRIVIPFCDAARSSS